MSVACGLECVLCVGCTQWAWKRCTYVGSYDSESWPPADAADFAAVPRICQAILAVYDPDLNNPKFAPAKGYAIDPAGVVKRAGYADNGPLAPPYIIYVDKANKEIVLAIRGLNLTRNSDYRVLLDNKLGAQMFDGGYVHHGLLQSAQWILDKESGALRELLREHGEEYSLVFAGHSLGSGIAALMALLVVNNRQEFDGISRDRVKSFSVAPARCMSLNLAVKYADVMYSVVLQDDFLPRTPTPLELIFGSICCLPCLLCIACLRDTFKFNTRIYQDPRRLYAPGRMYHIVERRLCRCGRLPPEVRTAIPIEGRFEHIVLSTNTMSDHAIAWIEREAQKALDLMIEQGEQTTAPPPQHKMERLQTLKEEHRIALEQLVSLDVPHAVPTSEADGSPADAAPASEPSEGQGEKSGDGNTRWGELVKRLFTRSESGTLVVNKDAVSA